MIIPVDDIIDRYISATKEEKGIISDILKGGLDTSYLFVSLLDGDITISANASPVSSHMIMQSVIESFTKKFGEIWLVQLKKKLETM